EWRLDRSVRFWNPAAERIFGYTHDEVASGDAFPLIVDEASAEIVDRVWAQLLEQSGGVNLINTNRTKDGRVIQCHWYSCPLTDCEGRVAAVVSFAEDITETVRAQQELRRANDRLREVVNKLPVIVWAFDEDLVPVLWNEHAERITGYPPERIIGNPRVLELLYPDEQERLACIQGWAELDFGDYDEIERPIVCADGSVRRILWSNIAARCPMPGWRAWGIGVDVTDRHEVFVALRESEKRYRDIIENANLAGIIVDTRGHILFVNEFFEGLTGWSADEVLGEHFSAVIADDPPTEGLFDTDAFRSRMEGRLRTKTGDPRTIIWTQSRLHTPGGEPAGVCALGMDVTDHRRVQAELAEYRDHLEQLVQERTAALVESQRKLEDAERLASMGRLAAGLSHDLGNMLLPVRCHLDTIGETHLEPRAREALGAVRAGIDFLGQLGDGLALLGDRPDDPKSWCDACCDRFTIDEWWRGVRGLLERTVPRHIGFTASIPSDLPGVCAPRHLLTRAVLNLLVNAVEAIDRAGLEDGRIVLEAGPGDGAAVLTVTDNGPGLPDDVARHAREPFFTTKTRTLSTGLGLSVVDGFARSVGGRFEITSPPAGGTSARLEIPAVDRAGGAGSGPRVEIRIPDKRLASLCEELLGSMGCIVTEDGVSPPPDFTVVLKDGGSVPDNQERRLILVDPSAGMEGMRRALTR
ncbi:MAG TPA: PAS domain-containing sensor histidine kinase, partial [Phycisphaerales bacterium]|nr:PAS domain-containing sensor histidine kinase [Phycisphaerales bacterium]